jgi:Outer membrane protein beta-barrel domain
MAFKIREMKNLSIRVLFILLLPILVFSQSIKAKRLSIGLSYEEDICYRQLNYSSTNKIAEAIRNNDETSKFGFTTGINFRYKLSNRITLELAVLYTNIGAKTKIKELEWATVSNELPNKSKTVFAFKTLAAPLKINYKITIGKLNTYITTGLSLNYLINRKTTVTSYFADRGSAKTSDNLRLGFENFTFSLIAGFGIDYPLSKRITLNVEPIFRQGVSSVNTEKSAKEYLYTAGINTRAFYNFKKLK